MNATGSNDLDPKFLIEIHEEWATIHDEIKNLQDRKKDIIGMIRANHGRLVAEGVKQCMNYMMKDVRQRHEAVLFAEAGRRYVEILASQGIE